MARNHTPDTKKLLYLRAGQGWVPDWPCHPWIPVVSAWCKPIGGGFEGLSVILKMEGAGGFIDYTLGLNACNESQYMIQAQRYRCL